jgi:hypothetical protein
MIKHPAFAVEEWKIRETEFNFDILAQTESIFALSNGHIGLRGNLDEGEPHGLPGTYLNSVYELRRLPYAEGGYGYPESGQTVINVPNSKLIRLLVDDEPFDVRYGTLESHERELDFRDGVLRRNPNSILYCSISPTLISTANRLSNRPTLSLPCTCTATRSLLSKRHATSPTMSHLLCVTPRCRQRHRQFSLLKWAISNLLMIIFVRLHLWISTIWNIIRATGFTSLPSQEPGQH